MPRFEMKVITVNEYDNGRAVAELKPVEFDPAAPDGVAIRLAPGQQHKYPIGAKFGVTLKMLAKKPRLTRDEREFSKIGAST